GLPALARPGRDSGPPRRAICVVALTSPRAAARAEQRTWSRFVEMLYKLKVRAFKNARLNVWWRHWRARTGRPPGQYGRLNDYVQQFAPGKTFVDVGCMWGVNGAHAFLAEESGASDVCGVDVFGPTPEFDQEHARRRSRVTFVLGDCTAPGTLERIGVRDVVFCAGVLYHHPSPFDVLVALRSICRERLIL